MISYPDDPAIEREVGVHDISAPVIVRDLVRIVEVMNLDKQGFFGEKTVLSGSMALRCFGSPRFTVYDADFSTSQGSGPRVDEMVNMLAYEDDDLEIRPSPLVPHDQGGTAWKSEPISFVPIFTELAPAANDRQFKADVSYRGLVRPGVERELVVPYDLGIWDQPPVVWIMDPHEIVAEKVLGWCVNRQTKHYADLGFIALATTGDSPLIALDPGELRSALGEKLDVMRALQPARYAAYSSPDGLIGDLVRDPVFDQRDWTKLVYVRSQRDLFSPETITKAVQKILVPMLRPPRTIPAGP